MTALGMTMGSIRKPLQFGALIVKNPKDGALHRYVHDSRSAVADIQLTNDVSKYPLDAVVIPYEMPIYPGAPASVLVLKNRKVGQLCRKLKPELLGDVGALKAQIRDVVNDSARKWAKNKEWMDAWKAVLAFRAGERHPNDKLRAILNPSHLAPALRNGLKNGMAQMNTRPDSETPGQVLHTLDITT